MRYTLTRSKEDFLPEAGFEMYYYDQLGCCNSDIPEDKSDMSLWTLPRYLEEVEEVRKGLGLEDFVILGHVSYILSPHAVPTLHASCFEAIYDILQRSSSFDYNS